MTDPESLFPALRERAAKEPLGVDISDYSDEFCAGFLAGQVNALDAASRAPHPCQRCGSEGWTDVDYAGCSDCREPAEDPAAPLPGPIREALGLSRSIIWSGESWSATAEKAHNAALAELDRLVRERDLVYGELNRALGAHAPKAWDRIRAALDA